MEEQFWQQKWQRGEIGFHEGKPNALLVRHLPALGLAPGARLFLPLCGKTRDIGWLLAQGYRVAGAELSRLAIEQLFAELGVAPVIAEAGPLTRFEAPGLVVFVGNIFDLDRGTLGAVDGVYDRAALVALPEPMRERYAAHLIAITDAAPQLLVSFDYDQSRMEGPPFAVTPAEIARHYDTAYRIACLQRRAVDGGIRGVPSQEAIWHLARR